jgi:hypothetical protein
VQQSVTNSIGHGRVTDVGMPIFIYLSWPAQAGKTLYIAIGVAGVAFNASPSISDAQLAQLTALYTRWGRQVVPAWTFAAEASAPFAGATLLSQTVTAGKSGCIYGPFWKRKKLTIFLSLGLPRWSSQTKTHYVRFGRSS